jgi:uncharacterized protein (TIGR02265 family)
MPTAPVSGKLVDGVFRRVLGPDLTPPLVSSITALGIDLEQRSEVELLREVWYEAIALTAAGLFPQHSEAERLHRLGRHVIDALQTRNVLNRPWLSMAKLLGPRRAMRQAAEYSERFSPVKLEIHERGYRELEIHVEEDRQLEFLTGLLEGLVAALGGRRPTVSVLSTDGARAVLMAVWS